MTPDHRHPHGHEHGHWGPWINILIVLVWVSLIYWFMIPRIESESIDRDANLDCRIAALEQGIEGDCE